MPRLLHLADVHLGARHPELGQAAPRQRERQAAAFRRAIDVGLEAQVDVALVCGDLFDSNAQPRRIVEAAALELRRLTERSVRVVIIPGTHDAWEGGSIYRVFDLRLMAGLSEGSDLLTVLTPQHPDVVLKDLDLVVYGRVTPTRRVSRSPLADFDVRRDTRASWRVAMVHGSFMTASGEHDDTDDEILFTAEEVAATGLDYLALGHSHVWTTGTAGSTTWAAPGPVKSLGPEQGKTLGRVAIVELRGSRSRQVGPGPRGGRRPDAYSSLRLPASEVPSQAALVSHLRNLADPNVVLDVTITGVADRWLDVDPAAVSRELEEAFLAVRVRDESSPGPRRQRPCRNRARSLPRSWSSSPNGSARWNGTGTPRPPRMRGQRSPSVGSSSTTPDRRLM